MLTPANTCAWYKIKNQNNEVCGYLFPTLHVTSKDILPLPESVYKSLKKCSALFIECLPSTAKQVDQFVDPKLLSFNDVDDHRLQGHIQGTHEVLDSLAATHGNADYYEHLKNVLHNEFLFKAESNHAKILACQTFLTCLQIYTLDLYPEMPLEVHLTLKAKAFKKTLLDLEKPEEVAEVKNWAFKYSSKLPSIPSRALFDQGLKSLTSQINQWKKGEPSYIEEEKGELIEITDKRTVTMVERMDNLLRQDKLIDNSTCISRMCECIKSLLFTPHKEHDTEERQRYFFAIGTGHCWGQKGAKRLLEANGWKLERVKA